MSRGGVFGRSRRFIFDKDIFATINFLFRNAAGRAIFTENCHLSSKTLQILSTSHITEMDSPHPTIWTNEAVISSFESVGYPPLCPMLLRRALHLLQGGCNISSVHTFIAGTMLDISQEKLKQEVAEHKTLQYKHEALQYRLETQRQNLETQLCKVELTNLKEKLAQGQDTCTYINIHAYTSCTIKRPSYNIMCLYVCT